MQKTFIHVDLNLLSDAMYFQRGANKVLSKSQFKKICAFRTPSNKSSCSRLENQRRIIRLKHTGGVSHNSEFLRPHKFAAPNGSSGATWLENLSTVEIVFKLGMVVENEWTAANGPEGIVHAAETIAGFRLTQVEVFSNNASMSVAEYNSFVSVDQLFFLG